jgi:ADP-ribose pyrophosphatase YjhB (NUDIX family)
MVTGGPRILQIPEGDNRERKVCPECGFIDYENPKVVVGSVVTQGERILLCRRAIDPRKGYWTIPAGYLELHESTEDGARREAQEEAEATIEIDGILAVYAIPRISQVQLIYRARLVSGIAPGPESLEVKLFAWEEIPWRDLAFPSVHWCLRQFREATDSGDWRARGNPPEGL